MWLLIVEAAAAMGVLIFIVWWTMFSGRPAELPPPPKQTPDEREQP